MSHETPPPEPHSSTTDTSPLSHSTCVELGRPTDIPRRRHWPAMLSFVATVVIVAAWIRSCVAFDLIEYRWGELAPLTYAQGGADEYQYNVRTAIASQGDGIVYVRIAVYVSFGVPREELTRQWEHWHGWEIISASAADRGPRNDEDAYYFSPLEWRGGGFGIFTTMRQGEDARVITLPHWFLALVAVIPFLRYRILSRRDRKRTLAGCCRRCGYDLRGGRAAQAGAAIRCPECGGTQSFPTAPPPT